MSPDRRTARPCVLLFALPALLVLGSVASAAGERGPRQVVVLYPDGNDGRPGSLLVDRAIRETFAAGSPEPVEIHSEYLDLARFPDAPFQQHLATFLKRKYVGRKIDLVIAGLAPALDFALEHRGDLFPGVPVVFCAIEQGEVLARKLPADVIGVPIQMELAATLDVALRLHPNTQHVFVVGGVSKFDRHWEAESRRAFQRYEPGIEFTYLSELPLDELLGRVGRLPAQSIVYYLHVFRDRAGHLYVPAEVAQRVAAAANAPVYGHVDTYIGRGVVGGRVFRFGTTGKEAAELGLRLLAGEKPGTFPVAAASESVDLFDWRQLRRWGIDEERLPPGSVVGFRDPSFWDQYKWQILTVVGLCVVQSLLIVGLLLQRASRRRALDSLRESQRELRVLTGKLLQAQETERRHLARELHDDLNQRLALLAVELDLLSQAPPGSVDQLAARARALAAQVKQLSSDVHDLSHQLHPAKLEQLGLLVAVRALCNELTHGHDLVIVFTHSAVPEIIPEGVALCLYRIAQEALQNVRKHSGARRAAVELSGGPEGVRLWVADDGAGFDPGRADGNGQLGLVSMRERLRLVGGRLTIDSRPGAGTRIEVLVPLQPEAAVAL